jgi:hypothetical protein
LTKEEKKMEQPTPGITNVEILNLLYNLTNSKWSDKTIKQMSEKKRDQRDFKMSECRAFVSGHFSPWLTRLATPLITCKNLQNADLSAFDSTMPEVCALFYFFALLKTYTLLPSIACKFILDKKIAKQLTTHAGYDAKALYTASSPELRGIPEDWKQLRAMFDITKTDDDEILFCVDQPDTQSMARVREIPTSTIAQYTGRSAVELGKKTLPSPMTSQNNIAEILGEIKQLIFERGRMPMLKIMGRCKLVKEEVADLFDILLCVVDEIDPSKTRSTGKLHVFGYSFLFYTDDVAKLYDLAIRALDTPFWKKHYGIEDDLEKWKKYKLHTIRYDSPLTLKASAKTLKEFVKHMAGRRAEESGFIESLASDYYQMRKMEKNEDSSAQLSELHRRILSDGAGNGDKVEDDISPLDVTEEISPGVPIPADQPRIPALRSNLLLHLYNVLVKCARHCSTYVDLLVTSEITKVEKTGKVAGKSVVNGNPDDTIMTDDPNGVNPSNVPMMNIASTGDPNDGILGDYLRRLNAGYDRLQSRPDAILFPTFTAFSTVSQNVLYECCMPEIASHFMNIVADTASISIRNGRAIENFDLAKANCRDKFQRILQVSWSRHMAINSNRENGHVITAKQLDQSLDTDAKSASILHGDSTRGSAPYVYGIFSRFPTETTKKLKQHALKGIWANFHKPQPRQNEMPTHVTGTNSDR